MPTHPNAIADDHLKKLVGNAGYTVSGSTATLTGSVDAATRATLEAGLLQQGLVEKVVAGVVTYVPR